MQVILTLSRPEKWMLGIATYIMQKILNFSCVWRLEFFVKSEICMRLTFSRGPLQQTCSLETTSLCLNTGLRVNKKFQNSHKFNWNYCKRLSFMCSPRNDKYNPSYSKTCQKKSVTHLGLCFGWLHFWHFEKLKSTFFTSLHFAQRVMY